MSEASPALKGGPPPLAAHPGDALPQGTRLAEFEIRQVLGAGGFGIVYLAWDHALEREVALKEYMPVTLAGRGPGHRVTIRAQAHEETFALGLRSFVNEARLLARFDHPSLVKVYRFWEDNGTAYMAMPMYHGRTLRQVRQAMAPGSPGEAWCRAMIDPMLGALERLHREDVYHRDIAPDNIVLTDEGHAVLLDFGAARRVIGDRSHALTAILKPHFAPIEQYADVAAMRQGPWTDLYGLAATVYYLLTGQPPLPAAARALHDELPPLARLQPSGCSLAFLQAVDWAMAVRPQERPQSVVLWRDVLEGRMAVPSLMRHDTTVPSVATRASAPPPVTDFDPTMPASAAAASVLPLQAPTLPPPGQAEASHPLWRGFTVHRVPEAATDPAAAAPPALPLPAAVRRKLWAGAGEPRRAWQLRAAAVAGVVGLLAAFAWVLPSAKPDGRAATAPAASAPAAAPALTAASAAPVEVETIETVLPPARPARRVAAPATAPTTVAASPASTPAGQEPAAALPENGSAEQPIVVLPAAPRERSRDKERAKPRPAPAAHAAVTGPQERCADRMFLTRLICMKHECDTDPRLRTHPECVRLQKAEQDRRERMLER
ncbi:serine/threonine protein kinase [Ideonella sp. BN130291]|uniref:serine/threonine protein kinase n=1 Tax=Ideonella sp. BN130291 TaxID=3112940 RepID=UPI002E25BC86|nr:protein kinase [Ideonella sp. BN130291]